MVKKVVDDILETTMGGLELVVEELARRAQALPDRHRRRRDGVRRGEPRVRARGGGGDAITGREPCLLYTSPSPRD